MYIISPMDSCCASSLGTACIRLWHLLAMFAYDQISVLWVHVCLESTSGLRHVKHILMGFRLRHDLTALKEQ